MTTKQEVKKRIEDVLNKYYKETGKEIISPISVFRVLNKKFNYKMEVKFNEQDGLMAKSKKSNNSGEKE